MPSVLLLIFIDFISASLLYSYADTDNSRRNFQDFLNLRFRYSNSRLETVTFYKLQLLTHKFCVNLLRIYPVHHYYQLKIRKEMWSVGLFVEPT